MLSINETDLGTPSPIHPIKIAKRITLSIDGREVNVPAGTSVLRAATEAGIQIPKLCATEMLNAFGSCRLCLVQIDGMKGYPASCTTPVADGMKVTTQNAKLADIRRGVMELYLSDHPLNTLTSPHAGHSEIEKMAGLVGVREVRYGFDGANHVQARRHDGSLNPLFKAKDESNPYFTFDPAACIVCSRCVRACDEVQGTFALTIQGRGFESQVAASQDESFLDSECVSCGACVQACPTSALTEKGYSVHPAGGGLRVTAEPVDVGRVAAERQIVLTDLRAGNEGGLEDLFLELTADTQRDVLGNEVPA